jgi:hypothetical protein
MWPQVDLNSKTKSKCGLTEGWALVLLGQSCVRRVLYVLDKPSWQNEVQVRYPNMHQKRIPPGYHSAKEHKPIDINYHLQMNSGDRKIEAVV